MEKHKFVTWFLPGVSISWIESGQFSKWNIELRLVSSLETAGILCKVKGADKQ